MSSYELNPPKQKGVNLEGLGGWSWSWIQRDSKKQNSWCVLKTGARLRQGATQGTGYVRVSVFPTRVASSKYVSPLARVRSLGLFFQLWRVTFLWQRDNYFGGKCTSTWIIYSKTKPCPKTASILSFQKSESCPLEIKFRNSCFHLIICTGMFGSRNSWSSGRYISTFRFPKDMHIFREPERWKWQNRKLKEHQPWGWSSKNRDCTGGILL